MLTHADLWQGIEELARREGCSVSGLARRAGLDATTFNLSKRQTAEGRLRWPSSESLARVLTATCTSLQEFAALIPASSTPQGGDGGASLGRAGMVPVLDQDRALRDIPFDDEGLPCGQAWEILPFPSADDPYCFVLELTDDRAAPLYRAGDRLLVSPLAALANQARRGDRLAIGSVAGELLLVEMIRQSPTRLDLRLLGQHGDDHPPLTLEREAIRWMGRILWLSQ